jgi:hypothetical protein
MKRAIRFLALAALAFVLQPYGIASAGGYKSVSTSCTRGLLGVGKCQVVLCTGSRCKSEVLQRGTYRKLRVTLNQCINGYNGCIDACFLGVQGRPPYDSYFKDCTNNCDALHFFCVDSALDLRG